MGCLASWMFVMYLCIYETSVSLMSTLIHNRKEYKAVTNSVQEETYAVSKNYSYITILLTYIRNIERLYLRIRYSICFSEIILFVRFFSGLYNLRVFPFLSSSVKVVTLMLALSDMFFKSCWIAMIYCRILLKHLRVY